MTTNKKRKIALNYVLNVLDEIDYPCNRADMVESLTKDFQGDGETAQKVLDALESGAYSSLIREYGQDNSPFALMRFEYSVQEWLKYAIPNVSDV